MHLSNIKYVFNQDLSFERTSIACQQPEKVQDRKKKVGYSNFVCMLGIYDF
jgi:hypothetical protein